MKKPADLDKMIDVFYKKKENKFDADSLLEEVGKVLEKYMGYEAKRDYADFPMQEEPYGVAKDFPLLSAGDPRIERNDSDEYNPMDNTGLAGPASSGRNFMMPEDVQTDDLNSSLDSESDILIDLILKDFRSILEKKLLINPSHINSSQAVNPSFSVNKDKTIIKFYQNKENKKIDRLKYGEAAFSELKSLIQQKQKEDSLLGQYLRQYTTSQQPERDKGSQSPFMRLKKNKGKQIKVYFKPVRSTRDYEEMFVSRILELLATDQILLNQAGNALIQEKPDVEGINIAVIPTLGAGEKNSSSTLVLEKVIKIEKFSGSSSKLPKADIVFTTKDKRQYWFSFKHGNEVSEAQQWGGISSYFQKSKTNFIPHPKAETATISSFVTNLKKMLIKYGKVSGDPSKSNPDFKEPPKFKTQQDSQHYESEMTSALKKILDLENKHERSIANKALFGDSFGQEYGINNVNGIIKGTIEGLTLTRDEKKETLTFNLQVESGFIFINHNDENHIKNLPSDYKPMIFARGGDRNDAGIKNCRIAIFPLGYRNKK